ncbi:MAG: Rieske 2Fe-2S domain-containing protein [Ginsengibacter sp.]
MENNKRYKWHKIANAKGELAFPPNGLLQIEVGGKQVCIAKVKEDLHACSPKCPHAGGIIADGFIDALNNVVCPLHRYKYNLQNGRNVSGEGYYLKIFPVDEREDGVYVGIDINSFLSWL